MKHIYFLVMVLFSTILPLSPTCKESSSTLSCREYHQMAQSYIKQLPDHTYQMRFEYILKMVEKITDEEAKKDLYYEVCRTISYFFDIKGFHQTSYLEQQTSLLHHGVSALITYQSTPHIRCKKIGNPNHSSYQLSTKKRQLGVFKKRTPPARETACWDLSHLFGCSSHIAPTFVLTFQGEKGSYQPCIDAKVSTNLFQNLSKLPKYADRVDSLTFWKVNLFALILGHLDLVTTNIPITKKGNIVLLDNEAAFSSRNHISSSENHLSLPIVNFMIEWPQAQQKLTEKEATRLNQLVANWHKIDLDAYFNHPLTHFHPSDSELSALKERLHKLKTFGPFTKNQTFNDLFLFFYPNFFEGVDAALPEVRRITKSPLSPYSALLFIASCRQWWEALTEEENQQLLQWIEKYHGNHHNKQHEVN